MKRKKPKTSKIVAKKISKKAPWGYRADGKPCKKPGRKKTRK